MASIVIELRSELARWLEASAVKRHVSVECAVLQLLEEERMRDLGATQLEVLLGGERWTAKMPIRGLLYTECETKWTRLPADSQSTRELI